MHPKRIVSRGSKLGFTLIEVLIALSIIAIAFAALLKANGQNIRANDALERNAKQALVAEQALRMIQLELINPPEGRESTESIMLFNKRWYWRAYVQKSAIKGIQKIRITTSSKQNGPFTQAIIGYRYRP